MDRTARQSAPGSPGRELSIGIILILAAGLLFAGCDRKRAQAVRKLNEGLKAYKRGSAAEAVEKMEKAAEMDADFSKPHYQAAQIYELELDQLDKAENHYRKAVQLKSQNTDYTYALARVLAEKGDYEDAVRYFRKTTSLDESHGKAWFRLGLTQRALGKHAEAVDSYMRAIEANPRMRMDDEDAGGAHYHALGDLYIEFDFYDKALKVYENGITNNPEAPRLYQGKGLAQLRLERYGAAAESFEKVLEMDDSHGSALYNLAVARNELGEPEKAKRALEKFLKVASRTGNQSRIAAAQGLMNELKDQSD
jgi:tetratricopeptide (TPR) repeat protein